MLDSTTAPLSWGGGPASATYGLNFPEAVTRLQQVVAQVRFKISKSLTPKFEYRFERFDDKNYQTASNPQLTNPYAGGLFLDSGPRLMRTYLKRVPVLADNRGRVDLRRNACTATDKSSESHVVRPSRTDWAAQAKGHMTGP